MSVREDGGAAADLSMGRIGAFTWRGCGACGRRSFSGGRCSLSDRRIAAAVDLDFDNDLVICGFFEDASGDAKQLRGRDVE